MYRRRQLGQLDQFPCPPGEQFNLSTLSCEPIPDYPPGYTPPAGEVIPPGGVLDRPCTPYEVSIGICPTGTLPAAVPPQNGPSSVPTVPGCVPSAECDARQQSAYDSGVQAERANVIRTAAVSAAVSAVVGIAIGWLITS
jgi:hypothetical protein